VDGRGRASARAEASSSPPSSSAVSPFAEPKQPAGVASWLRFMERERHFFPSLSVVVEDQKEGRSR
jgi:hypothetical protein